MVEELRALIGQKRPTIAQILNQFKGQYGRELEHFVYCVEKGIPIETAATDYLSKHPVDRSLIDSKIIEGIVMFHILTTAEGVDWMHDHLESFLDYLRDRSIALNGGKRRFWQRRK